MFGIVILMIFLIPSFVLFAIIKYIFHRHKIMFLRFLVKLKYSWNDYNFMTNLSMGVFVSSIIALVVSSGIFTVATYSLVAIISFIAMIDYNYKK